MASRARARIVARKIKKYHPWGRDFYLCSSILTKNYTERPQIGPEPTHGPVCRAPSSAGMGARRSPRVGRATQTRRESFPCPVSAVTPPEIGPKVGFASSAPAGDVLIPGSACYCTTRGWKEGRRQAHKNIIAHNTHENGFIWTQRVPL